MTLSWKWTFIFGAIGYGVFLGLGCGGLVAYNIWNKKNLRKMRQRQENEFYRSFYGTKGAAMSMDTLAKISDITGSSQWGDSKATIINTQSREENKSREGSVDLRRLSNLSLGGLSLDLDGISMASVTSLNGPGSRRNSRQSLDGISAISTDDKDDHQGEGSGSSCLTVSAISCIGETGLEEHARIIEPGVWEDMLDSSKHHRDKLGASMQIHSGIAEDALESVHDKNTNEDPGRMSWTKVQPSEPLTRPESSPKREQKRRSSIYSQLSKISFNL